MNQAPPAPGGTPPGGQPPQGLGTPPRNGAGMPPGDEAPTTVLRERLITHEEPLTTSAHSPGFDDGDDPEDEVDELAAKKARKKKVWRRIRRTGYVAAALAFLAPATAFAVGYFMWDVPDPQEILSGRDKTVIIQSEDERELMRYTPQAEDGGDFQFVPAEEIPEVLKQAIISVEDQSFERNSGFDPVGIARAAITGYGGGSGLTQQYIKQATQEMDSTYTRKFKELVLSVKITQEFSKDKIFESYINIITFGRGTTGPSSAMQAYFGRDAKLEDITPSQAAFLAGMIQLPYSHDPARSSHEHAETRWQHAVNKMVETNTITAAEAETMEYPIDTLKDPEETRASGVSATEYLLREQIMRELDANGYGMDVLQERGATVRTTIDPAAQQAAREAVEQRLATEPAHFRSSLVAVDPQTGGVIAYIGGGLNPTGGEDTGWGTGIDYATSLQQPGSSFKPFVTLAGLMQGKGLGEWYESPDVIEREGTSFRNSSKCASTTWCTVREATEVSANTPFIDMANQFGTKRVREAAVFSGIPDEINGAETMVEPGSQATALGIALGQYQVRTIDMAAAYATFAADGTKRDPHFVSSVIWEDTGEEVLLNEEATAGVPAFDQQDTEHNRQLARNLTESLLPVAAASQQSLADGRPVASKTGTHQFGNTDGNAKAWMVGYTPQISTAVWVGSDQEQEMRDAAGNPLYGRTVPSDIWRAFMDAYLADKPVEDFPQAVGIGTHQAGPSPEEIEASRQAEEEAERRRQEEEENRERESDAPDPSHTDEESTEPEDTDQPDPDPSDGNDQPDPGGPPPGDCEERPWECHGQGDGWGDGPDRGSRGQVLNGFGWRSDDPQLTTTPQPIS
ncbi:transglycosylase domain-containing protein [Actinoalloteichus sp. AHMU CJ021]|uniref:transglycosylase domain-containing protein n=1 Tax=Actinoalloteichus sp. AHMU CJ021 TaxID=2072503 RepID=UPI00307C32BA